MSSKRFLPKPGSQKGFTLVELLVVVVIIGVLIALLLPAIQASREAARRMQCASNVKQICNAVANYESVHGSYPPGRVGYDCAETPNGVKNLEETDRIGTSAFVLILPYIELDTIYNQIDFSYGGLWTARRKGDNLLWSALNAAVIAQRPPIFVCPNDTANEFYESPQLAPWYYIGDLDAATGSYAFCMGSIMNTLSNGIDAGMVKYHNNGVFHYIKGHKARDITDGLSQTIFLGETTEGHLARSSNIWTRGIYMRDSLRMTYNPMNTPPEMGDWVEGLDGSILNGAFISNHPSGVNFGFGDGHVVFLDETMDEHIYKAMSTRDYGDINQ